MALVAYRSVLRAARVTFHGDLRMYTAAKVEVRNRFDSSRNLDPGHPETQDRLKEALEVARILRQNVIQGEAKDGAQHYQLNIHSETERGDNETLKQKTTMPMGVGGCCGGGG